MSQTQALTGYEDLIVPQELGPTKTVSLAVPYGAGPGSRLMFRDAESNQAYQVVVPPGCVPGSVFQVQIPRSTKPIAMQIQPASDSFVNRQPVKEEGTSSFGLCKCIRYILLIGLFLFFAIVVPK